MSFKHSELIINYINYLEYKVHNLILQHCESTKKQEKHWERELNMAVKEREDAEKEVKQLSEMISSKDDIIQQKNKLIAEKVRGLLYIYIYIHIYTYIYIYIHIYTYIYIHIYSLINSMRCHSTHELIRDLSWFKTFLHHHYPPLDSVVITIVTISSLSLTITPGTIRQRERQSLAREY